MTNFAERHYRSLITAIWLITSVLLVFVARDSITNWKMGDPDDQLRLVQVRDWISGQNWSDITQYRMNAPDGGPMHWSRLVDIPIAATILLLRPLLGQLVAEHAAAVTVPLMTYGIVLGFYSAAVRRLWGALPAVVAAAAFFLVLPVIVQLAPMRIDHHGWQLALFCVGLWTLFDPRQSLKSSAQLGVAMALWLEISVEGLPFAVVLLAILAARWLFPSWRVKGQEAGATDGGLQFLTAVLSFTASLLALFAITENGLKADNFCDGLSPFHLASACAVAVVLAAGMALLYGRILKPVIWIKIGICAASALAGAATVLSIAPQCTGDAFATLDPLVRTYWYDRGIEGLPIWKLSLALVVQPLAVIAAGTASFIWLWRGDRTQPVPLKITLALVFIGCALVGSMVSRTIVYALVVAAMTLAPLALVLFSKAETSQALVPRLGWRLLGIGLLMPAIMGQNLLALAPKNAPQTTNAEQQKHTEFLNAARQCQSAAASRMLNRLPIAHIMAPLDTSPSILVFTPHSVVATGHHRNEAAMADVIRTFTRSADQAAAILKKRSIDYVLTCDGSFELDQYAKRKQSGFAAQLFNGKPPHWLIQHPDIGPFHLYKVDWSTP